MKVSSLPRFRIPACLRANGGCQSPDFPVRHLFPRRLRRRLVVTPRQRLPLPSPPQTILIVFFRVRSPTPGEGKGIRAIMRLAISPRFFCCPLLLIRQRIFTFFFQARSPTSASCAGRRSANPPTSSPTQGSTPDSSRSTANCAGGASR